MNTLVDGAMIHEQEIMILYDHLDRNYILPNPQDRANFDRISFGRWAIEEMVCLLADFPDRDAGLIVQEFAITMRALAARKKSVSYIFQIAADTADEVAILLGETEV